MRLDKYLKVSRLIKGRTLDKELADAKRIELNGKAAKPAAEVNVGDTLVLRFMNRIMEVEVISLETSIRKSDAKSMYKVISDERLEIDFDF